jgi:hypothetical protein
MKTLKISRWIIAILLVSLSVFYICLSTGKQSRMPYLATTLKSELSLTGDYNSLITVRDTMIHLQESIRFTRIALDTFVKNQYIKTDQIGRTKMRRSGEQGSDAVDSIDYYQSARDSYIASLLSKGWISTLTTGDANRLTRVRKIRYKMGFFSKTKIISVPLLFTSQNLDSVIHTNQNKDLVHFDSPAAVNYILSPASVISMIAREGSVIETYPIARRQNLLDENNNEVFQFRPRDINGNFFEGHEIKSTTINLKLLNPYYNNFIGRKVVGWSVIKLLSWTFTALVALFVDKVKSMILSPLADKIISYFKSPKKMNRK